MIQLANKSTYTVTLLVVLTHVTSWQQNKNPYYTKKMLTNLCFISIDDLNGDEILTWLAFWCLFGFDELNVGKFRLICQL